MSIHPSLRISDKGKKTSSVLKRTERLRAMIIKKQWKEGDDVFGLPKMKSLRIKIKKEKVEKAAAPGAAAPAAEAGKTAAKPAATAKPAAKPAK